MGRAKGKQAEERPKDDDDALLDAAIAENKATQKMKVQQPPEQKARGKGGKEVAAAAPGKALTKEQIMQKLNSVRRAPPQPTRRLRTMLRSTTHCDTYICVCSPATNEALQG